MPKIQEKGILSGKLVLLWRRQKDLASRTETLGYFLWAKRPLKPVLTAVAKTTA
jgi:hypothetical protein